MPILNNLELISSKFRGSITPQFASDAAFVTAKGSIATNGDAYYNTTTNKRREYANGIWIDSITTNATIIQPSTATTRKWQSATNPLRISSSVIRVDKDSTVAQDAIAGAPIRFSEDSNNWYQAVIESVVDNGSTLDLTIAGASFETSRDAFVDVGTPEQLVPIVFPAIIGNLSTGTDVGTTLGKQEIIWGNVRAKLVKFSARQLTASAGQDTIISIAVGSASNKVAIINLGQTTNRVTSGVTIDTNFYQINYNDKIFINVDQGNGTGANLAIMGWAVLEEFVRTQFIPIAPANPPYGFIVVGVNTSTYSNSIGYIDLATNTGGETNRGNDTVARNFVGVLHGSVNTHICDGGTGGNGEPNAFSTAITYFATTLLTGNSTSRATGIQKAGMAASVGTNYGYLITGATTISTLSSNVSSIDITLIVGTESNVGSTTQARMDTGGTFSSANGWGAGGRSHSGVTYYNIIEYISNLLQTVSASDGGDMTTVIAGMAMLHSSSQGYSCGGNTSGAPGTPVNTIQSWNFSPVSSNASNRTTLAVARRHAAGTSGDVYGNIDAGTSSSSEAVSSLSSIEVFAFTTGTITMLSRGNLLNPKSYLGSTN